MSKLMELAYAERMMGVANYVKTDEHLEARAALAAEVEKLERDAARWNAVMNFSGDLTLRLHNTRRDHRTAMVDKAMESENGKQSN